MTSAPGKESTFAVVFPPAAHPAKGSPDVSPSAAPKGSGVVLVIDDEQVARDMAKKALEPRLHRFGGGLAWLGSNRHPEAALG